MSLRLLVAAAAACLPLAACAPNDAAGAADQPSRTSQPSPAADPARDDATAMLAALPGGPDPAERAARAALASDASWRASVALGPVLADPQRRTPVVTVLAAAAAAQREEWGTVDRLLAGGAVPDAAAAGFGSLLQARSALARGTSVPLAREALVAARRAAEHAPSGVERGVRLALAARALDRLAGAAEDDSATRSGAGRVLADSARTAYAAAAALLPSIADWLALRGAELTRDSAARARVLAGVRLPAARDRAPASEATARERAGDRAGAAVAYASAGRRIKALSLRLADAGAMSDEARRATDRSAVRAALMRIVADGSGTSDARAAVELVDLAFPQRTPAEELVIARSASASGPAVRAVAGFDLALKAGLGTQRDRYSYATLLDRIGRRPEAIAELARVRAAGGALAGSAAYQRARLLLQRADGGAAARAALQEVVAAFPSDTAAASSALYLLADLAVDDGRDADARAQLLTLARRYPGSDRAPRARLGAAIIALAAGDAATAATELDAAQGAPTDTAPTDTRLAAAYWAGRAAAAAGDARRARDRWQETMRRAPASYYAMLAARRLGAAPWAPASNTANTAATIEPDVVDASMRRIALLERIGFDPEAGWERDRLLRWADSTADRQLAVARALHAAGSTSAGMRLARRALDGGAPPSPTLYRALYPWPWQSLVREAATARSLDPALAAAVIRQESNFTPAAVSPAGAVGLMQLMPPVGRSLWDALGVQRAGLPWSPSLLRQPDVNVALGARHLATAMARYPETAYALAAYNAGGTPVARWRRRPGTDDPELFVERIPYDETRDYVRIVSRNREFYRALYGR